MKYETVLEAIEKGGSIRAAAVLLGKSYTSVQWWLARNGYRVAHVATLVPVEFKLTDQGRDIVNAGQPSTESNG